MSANRLWYVFGTLGLLSTIFFIVGFGLGVRDVLFPQANQTELAAKPHSIEQPSGSSDGVFRIVAFGDSLTKGFGDETIKGYVGNVKEKLIKSTNKDVRVNNFAVNGYTSSKLLSDLMDHSGSLKAAEGADVVMFTIGGNDLYRQGKDKIDPKLYAERSGKAKKQLQSIMKIFSENNPKSLIVYVGLYNPFVDKNEREAFDQAVTDWNADAAHYAATLPNVLVVNVADLFARKTNSYLYIDQYHPNALGYERMATRVAQVLE